VKRSRSWRTVEVAGTRYRWRYGRGTIEIRHDRQVVLRVPDYALRGTTPHLFERGQHKGTSDGYVTPAMVRAAIAKTLGGARHPDQRGPARSRRAARRHGRRRPGRGQAAAALAEVAAHTEDQA